MQTIKAGDLYFLQSPFHSWASDDGTQIEKRLSYLLGTVSSRPAIVIRPPMWWDKFNTCTVIPALSHGDPAIILHLIDRYGNVMKADYPFIPHNPHTIPVSRLGKYMGSLTDDELKEVLYAYEWIHNPFMQGDPEHYPVPKVYADVMRRPNLPTSWRVNKDSRSNVDIRVKEDFTLYSNTNPELNGFNLQSTLKANITDHVNDAMSHDLEFVATENPLADSLDSKEGHIYVPVERSFPNSIFDTETLNRVASRFTISDAYYNDNNKRNPDIITVAERYRIQEDLTDEEFTEIVDYYKSMYPLDAYILGPRLPSNVLADITGFTRDKAIVLKRLCNFMRDIPSELYNIRLKELDDIPSTDNGESATEDSESQCNNETSYSELMNLVVDVKPYLNAKRVTTMPDELAKIFLTIPPYIIKRNWSGSKFNVAYKDAVYYYKKKLNVK